MTPAATTRPIAPTLRAAAWTPWGVAAAVALWAAWAGAFNQAQFGDSIEQFNWSQSLQWGYAKHPPLPTWLLGAAIAAFGRAPWLGYAAAAACFAATGVFTWAVARRLLGERTAVVALLLWSLQSAFSWRAQLYNHNTALVACIAAAVWCVLRALDGRQAWWLGAGLAAGCAMLSKYQALLPLAGVLAALAWTGRLRDARTVRGVAVAVAVMAAVFAPHVVWVMRNDFTTLRYAATSMQEATSGNALRAALSFVVNQLRMLAGPLAALLIFAVAGAVARRRHGAAGPSASAGTPAMPDAADADAADREAGRWLVALVWAPALVLLAASAFGVNLRNHWGVQTFQFVALWIAWRWQRHGRGDAARLARLARLAWSVLAVHLAMLALYAVQQRQPQPLEGSRRLDTLYPAEALAQATSAAWHAAVGADCPLRYVSGDAYLAGLAALYGGAGAAVHGDAAATPWVDAAALERAGRAVLTERAGDLPPQATHRATFTLRAPGVSSGGRAVFFGVVAPRGGCR